MARPRKPARLELRGRIWYVIDGGLKLSTMTDDPVEAKRALAQYLIGKASAEPVLPPVPLVRDLLAAYRNNKLEERREETDAKVYADERARLVAAGVRPAEAHSLATAAAAKAAADVTHVGSTETAIRHLTRHLGDLKTVDVAQGAVKHYLKARREEGISKYATKEVVKRVSNSTVVRELVILRAAINWAGQAERREAWFGDRAKPEFAMPSEQGRVRQRYLTKGEAARLLAACHLPHVRLFVRIALSTGARKEAIESLRWEQVDFSRNVIDFGWVSHRKRRPLIQMAPELREAMLAAKAVATSAWVIEWAGKRAGNVKKSLSKAIAAAGLRSPDESMDVTGHSLKHTFVSWLLHSGKGFGDIARLVNTSAQTLERHYGHLDFSRADEIGEAVRLNEETARFALWSVPEIADEIDQNAG